MADLLKKNSPETENPDQPEKVKKEKAKKEKPAKKQYLEHNNMNFLERYETIVEGKKADLDISAYKTPILIVAIVLLALLVFAQGMNIVTKAQVKSLNKYINDPANVASYTEAVKVKEEIDSVTLQKTNMENLIKAIATYPDVDNNFFTQISTAATSNSVTTGNYGYAGNNGYLTVACTAQTPQNVSDFVRAIEATGLFASVEYTGFTGSGEGGYSFNISCYCVAGK